MNIKTGLIRIVLPLVIFVFMVSCNRPKQIAPYEANWDSLANYNEEPDWFKDAKFGIYFHWGILCVPEFAHDWYPRMMHFEGSSEWNYHTRTYGSPREFGYHQLVPLFTAENFDADTWADLFQKSGARFAGMVAEHHDGFSMWASKINPWNAMDMGPKRDLVGEMEKAIHGRNMKFVTTFHIARNFQKFQNRPGGESDSSYFPYIEGLFTTSTDSLIRIMYGNIPKEQFCKNWLGKLEEVIDSYRPDLIYFDGMCDNVPDSCREQFAAYYLNRAAQLGKEVVVTHKHGDLPNSVSLQDMEKGRMDTLTSFAWLTDETVSTGSWSYTKGLSYKTPEQIVHLLIDIVSKNGCMMLNISPRPDGTIPQEQIDILTVIGDWLHQNGEAIYETRPWIAFGEGPTQMGKGGHFVKDVQYTSQDIRYTTKGNAIYALLLGRPEAGREVMLTSFANKDLDIQTVALLNSENTIEWAITENGLSVQIPNTDLNDLAVVFKIETASK